MKRLFAICMVMALLIGFVVPAYAQAPFDQVVKIDEGRFTDKYKGTTLNVIMVVHPTSDITKKHLQEFMDMTGMKVNLEITPFDSIHQKEMLDLSSGTNSYDVMMIDNPWVAEYVSTGNVLELTKYVEKEDPLYMSDMVQNVNRMHGQVDGVQYAISIMGAGQLFMYRKDLLEQEKANFKAWAGRELTLPKTWYEFNEIAKFFTKKFNPKSPTEFGITVAAQKGNGALCMFQPVLWGIGGREFGMSGRGKDAKWFVTCNNGKGVEAMKLFVEMAQYSPPGSGSNYWNEMNAVFLGKQCFMQIQWDAFAPAEEAADSAVKGLVGYDVVPGPLASPIIGGWPLVINKNTKNPDASWEFVRWATGPKFGFSLNKEGGELARVSLLTHPELVKMYPFYPAALETFKVVQQRTSPYVGGPTLKAVKEYEDYLGGEASAAFTGQKSAEDAVDAAAKGLQGILETELGY